MIASFSRSLLPVASLTTREGLLLRAANVQNGFLLREGSRCIRVGKQGAEMVELACHPAGVSLNLSHHKLFTAQVAMHTSLINLGQATLAEQVRHIYREAEAWDAFMATVVRLLETTFIRVGNEEYARRTTPTG